MSEVAACVGCGAVAPETTTNYTLISASHGWRLTRREVADGGRVAEWRCPDCWRKHKGQQPVGKTPAKMATTAAQALPRSRFWRRSSDPPRDT